MNNIDENKIISTWKMEESDKIVYQVTVRVDTYNHEKYIKQCLDSILMQKTNFPFKILVHDDASSDNTTEIVQEYARTYPKVVHAICDKENLYSQGGTVLIEALKPHIEGKYMAFCEGDDYWVDENKLQNQYDALEKHNDCTIAYCRVQFVDIDGNIINKTAPPLNINIGESISLKEFCNIEFAQQMWCFHTSSFFMRTEYYQEYIDEKKQELGLFPYGDITWQLFYLSKGKGYFVNKIQSCYRTFSGGYNSMVKENPQIAVEHENKLCNALRVFDEMTGYQYHEAISKRLFFQNHNVYRLQHTQKEYAREYLKYSNRKYTTWKGKIKLLLCLIRKEE